VGASGRRLPRQDPMDGNNLWVRMYLSIEKGAI